MYADILKPKYINLLALYWCFQNNTHALNSIHVDLWKLHRKGPMNSTSWWSLLEEWLHQSQYYPLTRGSRLSLRWRQILSTTRDCNTYIVRGEFLKNAVPSVIKTNLQQRVWRKTSDSGWLAIPDGCVRSHHRNFIEVK